MSAIQHSLCTYSYQRVSHTYTLVQYQQEAKPYFWSVSFSPSLILVIIIIIMIRLYFIVVGIINPFWA